MTRCLDAHERRFLKGIKQLDPKFSLTGVLNMESWIHLDSSSVGARFFCKMLVEQCTAWMKTGIYYANRHRNQSCDTLLCGVSPGLSVIPLAYFWGEFPFQFEH